MPALIKKTSFRYFVGYLFILVIPVLISIAAFFSIENRFRDELEKYGFSILNHIQASIDENQNRISLKSLDYAMDLRVMNYSKLGAQLDKYDIETLAKAQSLLEPSGWFQIFRVLSN